MASRGLDFQLDQRAVERLLNRSSELRRHMESIGHAAVAYAQGESPVLSGDYRGAWYFRYTANGHRGQPLLEVGNTDWKFAILEFHGTHGQGLHIAGHTLTWLEGSGPR